MYVLKANIGGPEKYTEYVYDDIVEVINGITVTERESTKEMLLRQDFDFLGEIDDMSQLQKFLHGETLPKVEVTPPPVKPEETKLVPITQIAKFTPDSPTKSWTLDNNGD